MTYIIPKAKKNLHQCEYHLKLMNSSHSLEELEINFAAFVTSARSVTFVLQKEFSKNKKFVEWYGELPKEEITCEHCGKTKRVSMEPLKGTKQYEMKNDPLCKFFLEQRNKVEKEGISGIEAVSTQITSFNSSTDIVEKPDGVDGTLISKNGISFSVYSNTPRADIVPANTTAKLSIVFILKDTPDTHLGKKIADKNFFKISSIYYEYLKAVVEEFTEVINKQL